MNKVTILLVITFVYGVLRLLTHTKLFDTNLVGILDSILPLNEKNPWYGVAHWLSTIFFYFSLCFQAWYWLFL